MDSHGDGAGLGESYRIADIVQQGLLQAGGIAEDSRYTVGMT